MSRTESSLFSVSGVASGREGFEGEDGEVEFLIVLQGGLCVFQLLLSYP